MPEEIGAARLSPPHAAVSARKFVAKPAFKGIVMVDISIAYPQADSTVRPRAAQQISAFYREDAKRYYDYAAHSLYEQAVKEYLESVKSHFPFRAYQVMQSFETPYNRASLLSIYYDRYAFTGGAHGNTVRTADTWQLSAGNRMRLSDFFTDSSYKSVFFEAVTSEIRRQIEAGNSSYFDGYVKNVFRYFDENQYYLTDRGFAIFYPLYTIAAYVQGIPVFIVPYETFGDSLKKRVFV